jgi:hypothetical protein
MPGGGGDQLGIATAGGEGATSGGGQPGTATADGEGATGQVGAMTWDGTTTGDDGVAACARAIWCACAKKVSRQVGSLANSRAAKAATSCGWPTGG